MKIVWSDFAADTLKDIFDFYKQKASPSVARKIKSDIFSATKPLIKFPKSGQIELNLEQLKEGHRYLVESNYKIVYKNIPEGILITDVFDTRQEPIKIIDESRKPNR